MNMDIEMLKALFHAGFPIWVVTGGALLCLCFDIISPKKGGKIIYIAGSVAILFALWSAFRQWVQGAEYAQDLLQNDRLTQFFVVIVLFVGLLSLFNSYSYLKVFHSNNLSGKGLIPGTMVSLILFSLVGMIFLFASDHLIVNFIGLETMSLAVYILVGSNLKDARSNEAAMKYYVMGSAASALLLYGVALLYGSYGTFRLSELTQVSMVPTDVFLPKIGIGVVFAGILFKLGLAPFHFWVPDVYEGAPTPVTGFMSTGVKVAAFAFFIRIITTLHSVPAGSIVVILAVCVVLTLLVGNLGAIVQDNVKRMLAYSSIAHAGYLLLGLLVGFADGGFDPQVTSAVLFYLMGYSLMTLGAFAVLSVMVEERREITQFVDLTGLGYSRPTLSAAFSLFMLSLLGLPATVGFAAKYGIFSHAVANGYISLAVFGIIMSLVSAYYYLRPLVYMYFRGPSTKNPINEVPFPLMISVVFCSVATVYLGLFPAAYIKMSQLAASIFNP